MESTCFTIDISEGVAHLVLSRPDAFNSMTTDFWNDLPNAVDELDQTGKVLALVISSTGKHFSAGMDLAVFTSGSGLAGAPGIKEPGRRSGCERSGTPPRQFVDARAAPAGHVLML